jgi:hypothetical protein
MSDYSDRPARRPRRRDRDDEDEVTLRRRSRQPEQVPAPVLPLIYGIASCLLSCLGPVGLALGGLAFYRANVALGELPDDRRGDSARSTMALARILGGVGMALSGVALVVALVLNFVSPRTGPNGGQPVAQQQPPPQPRQPQQPQQQRPVPGGQQPPAPKKPAPKPKPKPVQVTYHVVGDPPPDQQADRVRQALAAIPEIDPASVEVTASEIRFRMPPRTVHTPIYRAIEKLGYRVKSTTSTPVP